MKVDFFFIIVLSIMSAQDCSEFMHEIRNHLNGLYGLAQLIDTLDHDTCKDIILTTINSIRDIDSEFNLYRKTGHETIKRSIIHVNNVLNDIIQSQEPLMNTYHVNVTYEGKALRIYSDKIKFQRLLTNIISNAIKYNKHKGQVYIHTGIQYIPVESKILEHKITKPVSVITITDTGIGMSKDELNEIKLGKIFCRFKKINRPGTGLGMSIVYKMCKALQIKIKIESEVNIGTTIILQLPHIVG